MVDSTVWRRRNWPSLWPLVVVGAVVAAGVPVADALPPSRRAKLAPPMPSDPRTTLAPMAVFLALELNPFLIAISPVLGERRSGGRLAARPAGPTGLSSSKPPPRQDSVLEM